MVRPQWTNLDHEHLDLSVRQFWSKRGAIVVSLLRARGFPNEISTRTQPRCATAIAVAHQGDTHVHGGAPARTGPDVTVGPGTPIDKTGRTRERPSADAARPVLDCGKCLVALALYVAAAVARSRRDKISVTHH
jgi:hypothetical protein